MRTTHWLAVGALALGLATCTGNSNPPVGGDGGGGEAGATGTVSSPLEEAAAEVGLGEPARAAQALDLGHELTVLRGASNVAALLDEALTGFADDLGAGVPEPQWKLPPCVAIEAAPTEGSYAITFTDCSFGPEGQLVVSGGGSLSWSDPQLTGMLFLSGETATMTVGLDFDYDNQADPKMTAALTATVVKSIDAKGKHVEVTDLCFSIESGPPPSATVATKGYEQGSGVTVSWDDYPDRTLSFGVSLGASAGTLSGAVKGTMSEGEASLAFEGTVDAEASSLAAELAATLETEEISLAVEQLAMTWSSEAPKAVSGSGKLSFTLTASAADLVVSTPTPLSIATAAGVVVVDGELLAKAVAVGEATGVVDQITVEPTADQMLYPRDGSLSFTVTVGSLVYHFQEQTPVHGYVLRYRSWLKLAPYDCYRLGTGGLAGTPEESFPASDGPDTVCVPE